MNSSTENKDRLEESKSDRFRNKLEINNTLILAVATLAVTWCSYQSNLWNGIEIFKLADSGKYTRLAQQNSLLMVQHTTMDESIIIAFLKDVMDKRQDRINYTLQSTRPELSHILKTWLQARSADYSDAPIHPMVTKEYNALLQKDSVEIKRLSQQADTYWSEAEQANKYGDRYSFFTVVFSMVLFLAAIATKLTNTRLSLFLIIVSGSICVLALLLLFTSMPFAPG